MRVLILGAYGMLGHKVYQVLGEQFDVVATVRGDIQTDIRSTIFKPSTLRAGVDLLDTRGVENLFVDLAPDVVVNCAGIIKQLPEAHDSVTSIATNSLLPHQLAAICRRVDARFIHISTDCVFSGQRGAYREDDAPDPIDLYGRSKWLGEVVDDQNALTLRTSIIGRELKGQHALVEWFLAQEGPSVPGYTNAIFSGLPTIALARIIANVIHNHPALHGLYHVSSEPISKFDLLELMRSEYDRPVELVESNEVRIDRSLDSGRFRRVTGWEPPSWPELIREMAVDPTPYDLLRRN